MAEQLIKKQQGQGYSKVYPKTFTLNIYDKESGESLEEILSNFNCYFLSYNGSRKSTRLLVPSSLRRAGLWVTYVMYDYTVILEYYSSDDVDDTAWSEDKNWRYASNFLVGEVSINSSGNWVLKGEDTGIRALGEEGVTPKLRIQNNMFQVTYNEGKTWETVLTNPVYTQFRVFDNKLQMSTDLGNTWRNVGDDGTDDVIYHRYKVEDNVLKHSKDQGTTWETVSGTIASTFRWLETQGNTLGKILISVDEGKTWEDMSPEFNNTLKIQAYYPTESSLPHTAPLGQVVMVGPFNGEDDKVYYELFVYMSDGWKDVGSFQSINAGISLNIAKEANGGLTVPTVTAVKKYTAEQLAPLILQLNGFTFVPITASAYEAIEEKNENYIYLVMEDDDLSK